ncbi:hypothetical protein D2V93_06950 [Flagellimonas taeanensis]|nr:hypothetical protein D2V93_06950 [Allomuricauda taeanensis]
MKERLQHIIDGNTYQGLEVFTIGDAVHWSFLKLKRSKGELTLLHESTSTSLDTLLPEVDKKNPLVLVINTSKVLKKQIAKEAQGTPEQWMGQAFPNLDMDSFHFEIMESPSIRLVSICKTSEVNGMLENLKGHGILSAKVCLGVSPLKNSLPYLDFPIQGSNFMIGKHSTGSLHLENTDALGQGKMDIHGLTLSVPNLLPFSAILGHIAQDRGISNLASTNLTLASGFKNRRFFHLGLQVGLGTILVILLLNFVLFSHYRSKTQDMDSSSSIEIQTEMLKEVRDRVNKKETKLNTMLGSSHSKTSYYLDRVAQSLPNSILLDELVYQPLSKPVQEGKPIEVTKHSLVLSGETSDKEAFTQWTDTLEKMEWIAHVDILGYEYASSSSDTFSLKIELHGTGQ